MRCTQVVEAGAYVLGALAPAERSTYQRHMATCDECRAEVTDLAGLPGLLGRLDEATAVGLPGLPADSGEPGWAPPTLLTDVLGRVKGERNRTRRRYRVRAAAVAAMAACLALLASLGVTLVNNTAAPPGVAMGAMTAVLPGEPIAAVVARPGD